MNRHVPERHNRKTPVRSAASGCGGLMLLLTAHFCMTTEVEAQLMGQGRPSTEVARKLDPFRDTGRTWNRQIRTIRQAQQQTKKILKTASPAVSQAHREFISVYPSKIDEERAWFDRRKYRSDYVF